MGADHFSCFIVGNRCLSQPSVGRCYNSGAGSKELMKKSIPMGAGVSEFFGTHDGNVKHLESLLKVRVHVHDDNLVIDGPDDNVALVERMIADYAQLRAEGVRLSNGDLRSIIRIISEDTNQSL